MLKNLVQFVVMIIYQIEEYILTTTKKNPADILLNQRIKHYKTYVIISTCASTGT